MPINWRFGFCFWKVSSLNKKVTALLAVIIINVFNFMIFSLSGKIMHKRRSLMYDTKDFSFSQKQL